MQLHAVSPRFNVEGYGLKAGEKMLISLSNSNTISSWIPAGITTGPRASCLLQAYNALFQGMFHMAAGAVFVALHRS
jgi:hypothetical protein